MPPLKLWFYMHETFKLQDAEILALVKRCFRQNGKCYWPDCSCGSPTLLQVVTETKSSSTSIIPSNPLPKGP